MIREALRAAAIIVTAGFRPSSYTEYANMTSTDLIMQRITERVIKKLRHDVFPGDCKFENINKIDVSLDGAPVRTISGWALREKIRDAYVAQYRESYIRRAVNELFQKLDTVTELKDLVEDLQRKVE